MAQLFISYSSKDSELVDRIATFLQEHGVTIWIDHMNVTPGTANWDTAIRQGITQAECVLYVASQAAIESAYVLSELEIARDQGKKIIPLWIEGNQWSSVAPIGLAKIQHLDARGDKLDAALLHLNRLLGIPANSAKSETVPPRESAESHGTPIPISFSLSNKGFIGQRLNGVEVILPPTVAIPNGAFLMGSDKLKDSEAKDNESPQYLVPVATFSMTVFPLTVEEYDCFVRATKRHKPSDWKEQRKKPDHPIVNLTWFHAMAYAKWLAKTTGQPWRLPSEAEWEKAARGTDGRTYPWGDNWDATYANTQDSGARMATPVGSYPQGESPFGCLDMAGNVNEWTSSLKRTYPFSTNANRVAIWDSYIWANCVGWLVGFGVFISVVALAAFIPNVNDVPGILGWIFYIADAGASIWLGVLATPSRVVRGGSWNGQPKLARTTQRSTEFINSSATNLGVRLAHY